MDNSRKPVKNADDRPINSKGGGQYNMNFIDWNNEWCAVYNKNYDMNNPDPNQPSPIHGMSVAVFQGILDEEDQHFEFQQEQQLIEEKSLGQNGIEKIQKMKMGQSSKECSICCTKYEKGVTIMKLPCNHIYHESCLIPWFQKESRCPNCRFDLKDHFAKQNK